MSIITFWNNGRAETGKTLSIAAICTHLAIAHNYRILVVSTGHEDKTLGNCFWKPSKVRKNLGLFGPNANVALEEGFSGLVKIMRSNKLSPEIITNYTKVIFKDRLEIIPTFKGDRDEYEKEIRGYYPDLINIANSYYDLVLVDLDNDLQEDAKDEILKSSHLIVATLNQRLSCIDDFARIREEKLELKSKKTLLLLGRYDKYSKMNIKNVSRYLGEKNKVSTIPYNTLFFESCEEAKLPDLFLSLRKVGEDDRNGFFMNEVKRATDNIIYRLEVLR